MNEPIFLALINQMIPDLLALLAFVVVFFVRSFLKNWLPKIETWIDAHVNEKTQKIVKELGHEAFAYAETVHKNKDGAEKLQEALSYFNAHMSKHGLSNLTDQNIRAAIEKAWLGNKSTASPAAISTNELTKNLTQQTSTIDTTQLAHQVLSQVVQALTQQLAKSTAEATAQNPTNATPTPTAPAA